MTGLVDVAARDDLPDGARQNLQVHPERAVIHILEIEIEFLFPGQAVSPTDLRQPGDAGPNEVAAGLSRRVAILTSMSLRSRHVSAEHEASCLI